MRFKGYKEEKGSLMAPPSNREMKGMEAEDVTKEKKKEKKRANR